MGVLKDFRNIITLIVIVTQFNESNVEKNDLKKKTNTVIIAVGNNLLLSTHTIDGGGIPKSLFHSQGP